MTGVRPDWLPDCAATWLAHTAAGGSLRATAAQEGCWPSTVLRRVRQVERWRTHSPLITEALARLGAAAAPDTVRIEREARRILRRLCEKGAVLAASPKMPVAVVWRGDRTIAELDRDVAEAFALQEWIACEAAGKVKVYTITAAGRAELRRLLPDDRRRIRFETPLQMLGRRKSCGEPWLSPAMIAAGERLWDDFDAAQLPGGGEARDRVAAALSALGPGLADIVFLVCCRFTGLEAAEERLGWSARSGKVVLRIALARLVEEPT